jgi:hypothetical protein
VGGETRQLAGAEKREGERKTPKCAWGMIELGKSGIKLLRKNTTWLFVY